MSFLKTIQTSLFELTYGMKPIIPYQSIPELTRISYGKGFVAEQVQLLKKARQIVADNSVKANEEYKHNHDQKAKPHNFKGDKACINNQLFLGEKKLPKDGSVLYQVTNVIHGHKVDL
jgi:hypothetical protein